jgi:hypothetical protein
MRWPRPFLVRLIAIAVVVGGSGVSSRAPQALRAWLDTAGEIADAQASGAQRTRTEHRTEPAATARPPGRRRIARAVRPPHARWRGSLAWPAARSGRDVVTRKSSRLI